MSGFFFGPPDRELYGFYHPPVGDGRAVILCPSLGLEYQYAHRALRVLAQRLAENGSHVLRFDYRGTGNSWGKDTEVDLDQWCDDLDLAARELRTMSGKPRLDFVGLRLGGAVAQKVGEEFGGVDRLVLWDPVLNGADWIRGQLSVAGKHSQSSAEGTTDEGLEVGCHLASPSLLEQIDAIRTHGLDGGCFGEVFFL